MSTDALSLTFAALADPTRRGILAALAAGAATVKELASPFQLAAPTITKHLNVLERAGLIRRGRQAQWRPCELTPAPLHEVADWLEGLREAWELNYTRLDALLEELKRTDADSPALRPAASESAARAAPPPRNSESDVRSEPAKRVANAATEPLPHHHQETQDHGNQPAED